MSNFAINNMIAITLSLSDVSSSGSFWLSVANPDSAEAAEISPVSSDAQSLLSEPPMSAPPPKESRKDC